MKITKIDGVSHYKEKEKGVLKAKDVLNEEIKEIVKKRYDATIESKIYKEFIKLRKNRVEHNNEKSVLELIKSNIDKNEKEIKTLLSSEFKIKEKNKKYDKYMSDKNELDNDIQIYESVESLYFFIKEVYSGKNNDKWNISKIDLEKIMREDSNLIMLGYKLKKNIKEDEYPYLYKNKNKQKSTPLYTLLKKLIEKNKNSNQNIRESEEYEKIQEDFKEYKNRKINLLVKSIENNKINIQYNTSNNYLEHSNSKREKEIIEFFKKMIEEKNTPILKDKLKLFNLEVFFDEEFLDEIKELLDSDDLDKSDNKKISELRVKIFSRIREKIKENRDRDILENIYFLELKKYIENNLSHKKENNKNNNNTGEEKSKKLYLKFLKKVLFIDDNNRISIEKLKSRIDDNFKNLLIQHVIEYGKIKYYVENDDYIKNIVKNGELKLETKDLEYIKTKETLIRKMAVLVSFAANSYYNLFGKIENGIPTQEISDDLLLGKIESDIYINGEKNRRYVFKEKMLNYFFNSEIFGDNKIVEVLNAISSSIYNIRNGVNHFDKMILGKYNNGLDLKGSNTIKDYFNFKKKEIQQDLKDRFISNNLQYYYTENEIKKYFEKYKFEILKTKASFAPNFKRILRKGENLSISEISDIYDFFKRCSENSDKSSEYNEFMKTRNFLLKEMYYNNFYREFLSDGTKFEEAVKKVKKNKKKRAENKGRAAGKSYDMIEDYNSSDDVLEYISRIHKSEMERIEVNTEKNRKDTSKHIRDFIEEVFLEGFIKYLNNNNFKFLKNRNEVDKEREEIVRNLNIQIEGLDILNENDSEILNLYLFFNMIDNKRISEFRNDMIKYKQFLVKRQNIDSKFLEIDIEKIEAIIEFVIITKEKLKILEGETKEQEKYNMNALFNKFYSSESEYDEKLKKFIEETILGDKKNTPFYSTDGKTPIVHSNLEKMRKYGTENFLSKVLKNMKYTLDNMTTKEKFETEVSDELKEYKILEKVNRFKENGKRKKLIEYYNDCRCYLHKEWTKNKKSKEKFEYKEIYKKIIEEIRKYNYLENKEKLQNVYLLHEILSDLLARNVAFLNKWERDFKFIVIAIKQFLRENDKEKANEFLNPHKRDGSRDNFSVTNYRSKMKSVINNIHENFMSLLFLNNNLATGGIQVGRNNNFTWGALRNYIAHFEYLHKEKDTISFITQANLLIKLFSYDKKVQNHIIKSMKTLLEKYNIEIKFEIDDTKNFFEYKVKYINSKKGKMLGEKNDFKLLEDEFVKNVRELLEYEG